MQADQARDQRAGVEPLQSVATLGLAFFAVVAAMSGEWDVALVDNAIAALLVPVLLRP